MANLTTQSGSLGAEARRSTMLSFEDVSYAFLGLLGYQTLTMLTRAVMRWRYPILYRKLKKDLGLKFGSYFVFILGFILSLATAPICLESFLSTPHETDGRGAIPSMTPAAKLCLGTRGVLWISELAPLSSLPGYVTHHVLSLSSLAVVVSSNLPLRPLYLIYAGLITELFSDTVALLRLHGLNHKNSRVYALMACTNAVSLVALRAVPAMVATVSALAPPRTRSETAYIAAVMFYCTWLMRLSYMQFSSLGFVTVVWDRPAHILLPNKTRISAYRVVLGVSMVVTQMAVAMTYRSTLSRDMTADESHSLFLAGIGTVVVGLGGAKLVNSVMVAWQRPDKISDTPQPLEEPRCIETPKSNQSIISSTVSLRARAMMIIGGSLSLNGISVQGGLLFCALWLMFSPITPLVDRNTLLASAALCFPLGEAMGRVGCFLAGCCGSRRGEDSRLLYPPAQVLTSTMNAVAFITLAATARAGIFTVYEAGPVAIAANAIIRLHIDPWREDTAGLRTSATSLFAAGQLLVGGFSMVKVSIGMERSIMTACIAWTMIVLVLVLVVRALRAAYLHTELVTENMLVRNLRRPVIFTYAFAVLVTAVVLSDASGERGQSLHRSSQDVDVVWDLLRDKDFLSSAAFTVLISLVL